MTIARHFHGIGLKAAIGLLAVVFSLAVLKSCERHTPAGQPTASAGVQTPRNPGDSRSVLAASARPSVSEHPVPMGAAQQVATAATAATGPLVVVYPGLTAPDDLASGRAVYAVDAAPMITYGNYGPWVAVGSSGVVQSTTSFSSLPVTAFAAGLPSIGKVRETWTFWTHAQAAGAHVFALRADSPEHAVSELRVDGQGRAAVSVEADGGAQTSIGQVDLGAGWHTLTLVVEHSSRLGPSAVVTSIFMRGPDESAPVTFTPFALTPAAAPASATKPGVPASIAHSLSSGAVLPAPAKKEPNT